MKKVIIIAVAILAIACLASCNKSKTCACSATVSGYTVSEDYVAENGNCGDVSYTIQGVKVTCKAK